MKKRMKKQAGLSIIEFIIALTLVLIVIVGWLRVTSNGIQNNYFVVQMGEVDTLGKSKAQAVIDNLTTIIPYLGTQTVAGSLIPNQLLPNYSDQLNESGCVIGVDGVDCSEVSKLPQTEGHKLSDSRVPRFTRQWVIKENFPDQGNISVMVRLERLGPNPIVRMFKETKADGVISH